MPLKRIAAILLALLALSALLGCAFVNISLTPQTQPLEEVVIEGSGPKKILLMDVTGIITAQGKESGLGSMSEPSLTSRVREELRRAEADPDVAGIVLRIDSPGGEVSPSDAVYHEITEFRKRTGRPVYASILGLGASGGYYIASAADRIFAQPTAVTGSIGVIAVSMSVEGLLQKVGIREKLYASGPMKGVPSPFRDDTPEERAIMQGLIDTLYDRFVSVVVEGRAGKLTREQVLALADGRPLTAQQAHVAGLVDEIGYTGDAVRVLREDLKLAEATVVAYTRPGRYRGSIYSLANVSGNTFVNVEAGGLFGATDPGVRFLYLWRGAAE